VFRGKVYDWRIQRNLSYQIHCSLIDRSGRVSIEQYQPLPFDEETETDDNSHIYQEALEAGYFEKPI
jgi:hypothetical protein